MSNLSHNQETNSFDATIALLAGFGTAAADWMYQVNNGGKANVA